MKLSYKAEFQLEGNGIKASGSANLQAEVDETTHGPLVDLLKAVIQSLNAPVQTDGDEDDDEWGDWQKIWGEVELDDTTHIYSPLGQLLNVVPRPSREDDGDTIHVVVYGNFPKDWVVAYSDAGMQGFGPLNPNVAECWLEIFAPQGRQISVTFVDDIPAGCDREITHVEVRDAYQDPLFVTLYPYEDAEGNWGAKTSQQFFPPAGNDNLFEGFLNAEVRLRDKYPAQPDATDLQVPPENFGIELAVETPPADAQVADQT